jgi:tetratricopeptide (TPR) repeat protein
MLGLDEDAGDLLASIQQAERCLKLSPESMGSYMALWHITMVQGDYCKAEEYLQKSMMIFDADNDDGSTKSNISYKFQLELALVLERQGRHADALTLLQKASEGHDADERVFLAIGDLLLRGGKTDQAELYFKRANTEQPDSASWLYLGVAQSLVGKPVLAKQSFRRAIEADSDSHWIVEGLQRKKAQQALQSAGNVTATKVTPSRLFGLLGKSMCFLEDTLVPWPNHISCSGWYHH